MFSISFYILLAAFMLMAVLMFLMPIPRDDRRLRGYRISRWLLSVSYVALAFYCWYKRQLPLELLSPIFLFTANLQACLLALSHVNLINPQRVTLRYVAWHFVPNVACAVAYIVVYFCFPRVELTTYSAFIGNISAPNVVVRTLWMIEYVAMCIYFIVLFVREYRRWISIASDFFADDAFINIRLISTSMVIIIGIGIETWGITSSLNPTLSTVLNMVIMLLYIILGVLFLRYPKLFMNMKPLLFADDTQPVGLTDGEFQRWHNIRSEIISRRLYLQKGITLNSVAREVGLCRTSLSNLINSHEGKNFNTFINGLRIIEAQRLMREYTEKSVTEIAALVGFSEPSNFTLHFKLFSGKTPSEWKKITDEVRFTSN
ncbi:MAG: AraC family transcriptional regulator [Bacteroidales bacterium]|nr:AraC family transcriptional regulator [Bacteroidales bacterium]